MKITVTDATFPALAQERAVAEEFGAEFVEAKCASADDVTAAADGTDILIVQFAQVTAQAIAKLAPGSLIVRYGIGLDNIDLAAAQARGVKVAYVPDYATGEVADHTASLILATLRCLLPLDRSVRDGKWDAVGVSGALQSFADTMIGFIGFGRIGQGVLARLKPFGFRSIVADPYADQAVLAELGAEAVDLDTLFARADAITLHCPLTPETRHVVNAERLAARPGRAALVNTARGGLVDPDALAGALESGLLRGAALDVFETEPLPLDSPLRTCPNLILTPHAAWYSISAIERLQGLAADEVRRHLTGAPMRRPAPAG
ncbi:C-terminal binding protein [Sphingomonas colocasiae]|uniref:C-terminal binding protein n=1 Tax=Sphingomonas colocasiae TaxID=1848973 RepID=A0ABS7PZ78_9SPHN|nr:C-terminal binding protein [Sphingomonas colocasiae]MBY8826411.1 C-terminal binding protein [Sphingomonas colocasiae]